MKQSFILAAITAVSVQAAQLEAETETEQYGQSSGYGGYQSPSRY